MRTWWGIVAALALVLVFTGCSEVATSASRWVPTQGMRWQYQLQGDVDTDVCARTATAAKNDPCVRPQVFDIDLYDKDGTSLNTAAVAAIHARDAHAVCYVDAGTWENWRPDANKFPANVLGKSNGWPGEKWLDIRRGDVLMPILNARVAKCANARFDAVDFDNVDGYANDTGFPLTEADQLTFNRALARAAHARGMSVGLKNDLEQLDDLKADFDFAVNEQCFQYNECDRYDGFVAAGKAVVEIEYQASPKKFCVDASQHGRDAMRKKKNLLAKPWAPCE
jgi:hypothetical protein